MAKEYNIPVHSKKDSTGICFIGERRFTDFLKQYLPAQAGKIVLESGKEVGEHFTLEIEGKDIKFTVQSIEKVEIVKL